jgi:hypothetical protein
MFGTLGIVGTMKLLTLIGYVSLKGAGQLTYKLGLSVARPNGSPPIEREGDRLKLYAGSMRSTGLFEKVGDTGSFTTWIG